MVQIKPADADRFLSKPDPAIRVVLVYGSDDGLVTERAERFARAVTGSDGEHLRLDPAALSENPGRLADEANAIPMFGGRRAISLRVTGNRALEGALQAVLDAPPVDSWIVVIAGELRKTAPLRKLCEASSGAAAIPAYADTERDLDRLIDEETRSAHLAIAADARTALKGLIGGDRLISRSEVQKLCLYAADAGEIKLEDVRALIGDGGAFAMDETVDALAEGSAAALDRGYRRLISSGTPGLRHRRRRAPPLQLPAESPRRVGQRRQRGDNRPPRNSPDLSLLPPVRGSKTDRALAGRPHRASAGDARPGDARQPPPRPPRRRNHRPGHATGRHARPAPLLTLLLRFPPRKRGPRAG